VKDGVMTITAANLSADHDITASLVPTGCTLADEAEIVILGDGDIRAYNTFEDPERVAPAGTSGAFDGTITIPRGGIAAVTVKIRED